MFLFLYAFFSKSKKPTPIIMALIRYKKRMFKAPIRPPKIGTKIEPREIMDCPIPMAFPWIPLGADKEINTRIELKDTAPKRAETP